MTRRFALLLMVLTILSAKAAHAQSFGIELLNNLMPASGAMAGTSLASPQDVQSAIKFSISGTANGQKPTSISPQTPTLRSDVLLKIRGEPRQQI